MTVTLRNRVLFLRNFRPVGVALSLLIVLNFCLFTLVQPAQAATNTNLNFQARLQTAGGGIVADGYYNVQFKLYGVSSGGTALWTESHIDTNGVTAGNDFRLRVKNGYLTANLGSQTAFPSTINWDQDLWITMNVGGVTQTATPTYDGEMNPRLKLTGVPYAFKAGQLAKFNSVTGFTSTLELLAPTGGNQIFQVADQGAAGTYTLLTSAAAAGSYIQNTTSPQTANFNITGSGVVGGNFTANGSAVLFKPGTNSATAFQVQPSGSTTPVLNVDTTNSRVGIGTAAPARQLHISSGAGTSTGLRIDSTATGGRNYSITSTNNTSASGGGKLVIFDDTGSTERLVIDSTGSVGIGNTGPSYKLDVTGDINTSTGYRVGGTAGISATCSGGQFLQNAVVAGGIATGGTCAAAAGDGGVTVVGAFSTTSIANGASISGNTITLGVADAVNPGMISTGTQTIAGAKVFTGSMQTASLVSIGTVFINTSGTGDTNIGAGSNSGDVYIGNQNAGNEIVLQANNITLDLSGNLAAINNLALNGNYSQGGSGTFQTGTGAVSLRGNTTVGVNNANAFRVQTTGGVNALTVNTSNNTVYATNIDALTVTGGSPGTIGRTNRTAATSPSLTTHGTGSYTPSGTFTPAAGTVLVAHIIVLKDASGTALATNGSDLTISGGGLTWVPIIGRGAAIGNTYDIGFRSFYAVVGGSPSSMQVTADAGSFAIVRYQVFVDEYTNVDTSTPVAGAVAANRMSANNNTFSLTLGATPTAGDVKIGVSGMDEDYAPGGYDTPAGWTEINRQPLTGDLGPDNQVISRTGVTTTSLDWDLSATLDYTPNATTAYGGFILKQNTAPVSTTDLNVGTAAANTIIGNTTGSNSVLLQAGTSGVTVRPANSSSAFQVQTSAGNNVFNVNTTNSSVTISAAATTYTQRLCHSQGNGATTGMILGDCASADQADLAEFYDAVGPVEPGDIVAPSSQGNYKVEASTQAYQPNAIGIVSTNPIADGIIGHNLKSASRQPVALAGRVPVKVSLENGPITVGDPLTASSKPGTAMKATGPGQIIGYALEAYGPGAARISGLVQAEEDDRQTAHASELAAYRSDPTKWAAGTGKIMVFVQTGYNQPTISLQVQTPTPQNQIDAAADINAGKLNAVDLIVTGNASVGGDLVVQGVTSVGILKVSKHIVTTGQVPIVKLVTDINESAQVSISGNDTAGTITVTTGDIVTSETLLSLIFAQPFDASPRVVLTPVGKQSAALLPYVDTPTGQGFNLGISSGLQADKVYTFNYHTFQ